MPVAHLVEQRLEQVVVRAVDERDVDRRAAQPRATRSPPKPPPMIDDPVRRRGRGGFHGADPGYRTRADRAESEARGTQSSATITFRAQEDPPSERVGAPRP